MIQAIKELVIGLELNKEYTQITYYHKSMKEPVTLGSTAHPELLQIPLSLYLDEQGKWRLPLQGKPLQEKTLQGKTSPPDGGAKRPLFFENLYELTQKEEVVTLSGRDFPVAELWKIYFHLCLGILTSFLPKGTLYVMLTVRELTKQWNQLLVAALEANGIERRRIYLQDYLSSFYYYSVNQRREYWASDVALLEYVDDTVIGYVLHIERNVQPPVAQAEQIASQNMGASVRAGRREQDWKKEKDRLFLNLLKKIFEPRTVGVSYLMGDFFDKSWAEQSIQYLCYHRRAFQGKNLFSKGACYAAMERVGLLPEKGIIYGGQDMVKLNLSMEMRVRGKNTVYPLVTAGTNWYEARHSCEFILNGEREIRLISHKIEQDEEIVHALRLPGMPLRPNRATAVRLTVSFSSPENCSMEVEDLGFGGLYRSSGLVWKRTLEF